MTLISREELEALSEVALGLMASRVRIYHQTDEDSAQAPPNDSWDDSIEADIADDAEPDAEVDGWFRNQPDYQLTDAGEAIQHEEDGRLFVPLGTELSRKDKVVVLAVDDDGVAIEPGTAYRVIDTNVENTWKVLIRASLKRLS